MNKHLVGRHVSGLADKVERITEQLTLAEKVAMMSGKGFFMLFAASGKRWGSDPYRAGGGCERLNIPPFYFTDGPRGVARGHSTCFPCTMARGASFDPDLEYRIGEIIGIEARAQGCNLSGAVCVNILRHPAWGRAQETYGEDSHHLGVMGSALSQGIQTHNVAATVKHFAVNSIENARFKVDVKVDDRTLREVYLPHFKRIIDDGCATVMSAYNKLNGEYCGENRTLLTDILRDEWGFEGFVHSDWVFGVHTVGGAVAGLDVENPEPIAYGEKLLAAVESGVISEDVLDTSCRRILTTYFRFADAQDPLPSYDLSMVASESHCAVAREAAEKACVLLKNENQALPINSGSVKRLAIIGELARTPNLGDMGSSRVEPPYTVSIAEGIEQKARLTGVAIDYADEHDLERTTRVAETADVVVAVVGYTAEDEGEYIPGDISLDKLFGDSPAAQIAGALQSLSDDGDLDDKEAGGGDRDSLELSAQQVAMIKAASAVNSRVVVLMVAGSAVIVEEWKDKVSAIMQTFYAGMEGGNAVANIVFGDIAPSGKLPYTVPKSAEQLPFFDKDADVIGYGPEHGYVLFDSKEATPEFAFGHGLSYCDFDIAPARIETVGAHIQVTTRVSNLGAQRAAEVVQVYIGAPNQVAARPERLLKGFQRVELAAGENASVSIEVELDDLRWWNPETRAWEFEHGEYKIWLGASSDKARLAESCINL